MLCPLLEDETLSPTALREIVWDFYSNTEECLNQSLQRMLAIDVDARHRELLGNPNEWEVMMIYNMNLHCSILLFGSSIKACHYAPISMYYFQNYSEDIESKIQDGSQN